MSIQLNDFKEKLLQIKGFQLANGARLWTAPCASSNLLTIQILIRRGSLFEQKEEEGFAHFLEHLVFKQTKTFANAKLVAEAIESLGGDLNAYTAHDHMVFHASGHQQHWQIFYQLLHELVFEFSFSQKDVNSERFVVLEEIYRSLDHPSHLLFDNLFKLLFPGETASCPILGTQESISSAQATKIRKFAKKFFDPKMIDVLFVGDLPNENELKKVFSLDHPIPLKFKKALESPKKTQALENRVLWQSGSYEMPRCLAGFKLVESELSSAQWEAFSLLMSQGLSAPLEQEYIQKQKLPSISFQFQEIQGLPPLLFLQSFGTPDQLNKEIPHFVQTLRALSQDVTDDDFSKLRLQFKTELYEQFENFEAYSDVLKDLLLFERSPEDQIFYWQSILNFSREEAQLAANELMILKEKKQTAVVGVASKKALNSLRSLGFPPKPKQDPFFWLPQSTDINHLIIGIKREFPLANSGGKEELALSLALKAPSTFSSQEFSYFLDSKAIEIESHLTYDGLFFQVHSLSEYFSQGIQCLHELFQKAAFREEDWHILKNREATLIKLQKESPFAQMQKLIRQHICAPFGHYGRSFYREEQDLETSLEDLRKIWQALLDSKQWFCTYSSKKELSSSDKFKIASSFGEPSKSLNLKKTFSILKPSEKIIEYGHKLDKEQTLISYCFPSKGWLHLKNYLSLKLVALYFSGQAGILFDAFREKKPLAYSVDASYIAYENLGLFSISGACSPKNLALLKKGLIRELGRFMENGFESGGWERARATLETQLARKLISMSDRVQDQLAHQLYGRNIQTQLIELQKLRPKSVLQTFEKSFLQSQIFYLQVGVPL
jgi:predicted Zn-dependent peptidase